MHAAHLQDASRLTKPIHGTNPLNLVEKIVRNRILESAYWREHCFGLNAEGLVEKGAALECVGGVYTATNKPTPFLCLTLKMLQMTPQREIIQELLENADFKYLRALAAMYIRLTGSAKEIYERLEPLYMDYAKLRIRDRQGWKLTTVDEFVDTLLTEDFVCDISLPRLPERHILEVNHLIAPYESPLLSKILVGDDSSSVGYISDSDVEHLTDKQTQQDAGQRSTRKRERDSRAREDESSSTTSTSSRKKRKAKKKKEKKEKKTKEKKHKKERLAKKLFIKGLKSAVKDDVSQPADPNVLREQLGLNPLK